MNNITENKIKFNDLEEKIWKIKMEEGLIELKYKLKKIDNMLLKNKNNPKLVVKDFQKTTIKCKLGELEIYRRRYKYEQEDGSIKWVYLLDEYMELGFYGQYSESIVEMVMKEVVEKSYRRTAETIMENTNVSMRHTAARNIVLKVAEEKIKPYEEKKLKLYEEGYIEGEKEQEIIYEEADGIFIAMQDKKRKNKKRIKKEVKIAVIHEGFEKRYNKDYKIKNKQIVATMENSKKLKKLVDMRIGTTYSVEKLKKIIINADGADWCKDIAQGANERYQLDMFHIQKKIREAVSDKEYIEMMSGIVKTDKPEYIFNIIYNYKEELKYEKKLEELMKVEELEKYLKNNEKGLLRYQYELGYNIEELNEMSEEKYRNLGTEESQMYCVCRKRMKKNRTSWSKRGAEALIKVIAYMKNNEIEELINGELEKKVEIEIKSRFPQPKKVKKIKNIGKIRYCGKNKIIENLTGIRKQYIKELFKLKGFNEMRLIGE